MATLTAADVRDIWAVVYRKGDGKEEFGKPPVSLPTAAQVVSIAQAAEDRGTAAFNSFKTDAEAILGRTLTVMAAKKFFRAWLRWRDRQGG